MIPMKPLLKALCLPALLVINSIMSPAATRYAGGDISLLPEYEAAGATYKDAGGNKIDDLLPFLYDKGLNAMRVRLFVNPDNFEGHDPNACQSLPYILPLCKRIVDYGFALILDFHYSDTWADPGAQWIPGDWEGLTDAQLVEKIYEYTSSTLRTLREAGIEPAFIQPGNEISYGMLWSRYGAPESEQKKTFMGSDANWQRLGELLRSAIRACREECPGAAIIIHTERTAQPDVQSNFYNHMKALNVDYDIIGLSYYPYFHGRLESLDRSLESLEKEFPEKDIMIVETGFPYKWEVPGSTEPVEYDYSAEGQKKFTRDLVDMLERHPKVDGLFWWWLEYNAFGTPLGNWYNAPLFDSLTGMATPALDELASFASPHSGVAEVNSDTGADGCWYNLQGIRIPAPGGTGIYIRNGRKILIFGSR